MKTTMKKVLSMTLALILLLGTLPMAALAAEACSICGTAGHAADPATHCSECNWYLSIGHAEDCSRPCPKGCGETEHDGHCCSRCGSDGHTADNAIHCDYCNWVDPRHAANCPTVICPDCGDAAHEGNCCDICDNVGHTESAPHCNTCHWVLSVGHAEDCLERCTGKADCPHDEHKPGCKSQIVCAKCNAVGGGHTAACTVDCDKSADCPSQYGHKTGCLKMEVCPTCLRDGGRHTATCVDQCTVDPECTNGAHKAACPAPCTKQPDCTSKTHKDGCTSLMRCTYCGKKGHELGNCPDVYYNCGCPKTGHLSTCTAAKWSVTFNPNYGNKASTVIDNVLNGTRVADVYTPSRVGYSFDGWYWDAQCTEKVRADEVVNQRGLVFYAKWTQTVPHEVYVKVYTNGNTTSVAKYVDLYSYAQDGVITLDDVKAAIKPYIEPNTKAGLQVYGPFNANQWDSYCSDDYYRNPQEKIFVNSNEKTVIYAMAHNAKIGGSSSSTSGSKADKTNPKTGDEIFMPVAILGMSASALAVAFYLNKKRVF